MVLSNILVGRVAYLDCVTCTRPGGLPIHPELQGPIRPKSARSLASGIQYSCALYIELQSKCSFKQKHVHASLGLAMPPLSIPLYAIQVPVHPVPVGTEAWQPLPFHINTHTTDPYSKTNPHSKRKTNYR